MGYRNDTSVANVDTDLKQNYLATLLPISTKYVIEILSITNIEPLQTGTVLSLDSISEEISNQSKPKVVTGVYLQGYSQICACMVAYIKEGFQMIKSRCTDPLFQYVCEKRKYNMFTT